MPQDCPKTAPRATQKRPSSSRDCPQSVPRIPKSAPTVPPERPNASKNAERTIPKRLMLRLTSQRAFSRQFRLDFYVWSHFCSNSYFGKSLKKHCFSSGFSMFFQNTQALAKLPQMRKKSLEIVQKSMKDHQKINHLEPQRIQERPRTFQECPKSTQERPQAPQNVPRTPKSVPRATKRPSPQPKRA